MKQQQKKRAKKYLRSALCSYDAAALLVLSNYLAEMEGFGQCVAYRSGKSLLRELTAGHAFDVLIVDERLLDMDVLELLEQMEKISGENRPLVVVLSTRQFLMRYEHILLNYTDCCLVKPFQAALLAQRIQKFYNKSDAAAQMCCEALYCSWGIPNEGMNSGYLTDVLTIVVHADEKLALRKEIMSAVGNMHGVSVAAVDSGLRRLIEHAEQVAAPEYRAFKRAAGLGAGKPTISKLLGAMRQYVQAEGERAKTHETGAGCE